LGKLFTIKREGQKKLIFKSPFQQNHFEKTRKEKDEFGLAETEKKCSMLHIKLKRKENKVL
jgi:hypothetical protein